MSSDKSVAAATSCAATSFDMMSDALVSGEWGLKPYAYKQWEHYARKGMCDRVPFA